MSMIIDYGSTIKKDINKKKKDGKKRYIFMKIDKSGTLVNGVNRKVVKIPKGVMRIGKNAFRDYDKIEEVIFNNSLEYIDDSAFNGCTSLKRIDLSNIKGLGVSVFTGCYSLEEVFLPKNLKEIPFFLFNFAIL